jgi:hypothetical protein
MSPNRRQQRRLKNSDLVARAWHALLESLRRTTALAAIRWSGSLPLSRRTLRGSRCEHSMCVFHVTFDLVLYA